MYSFIIVEDFSHGKVDGTNDLIGYTTSALNCMSGIENLQDISLFGTRKKKSVFCMLMF